MDKRPFIIDCDTGTDDAVAIIAALCLKELDVRAVTSVNGNVQQKYTSQNNLNITEYLGSDIPVARGAARPLADGFINPGGQDGTHGVTGMGTVILPQAERKVFDGRIASELIYEEAVKAKGELELIAIGPMTNIAVALINHPDLTGLIKHIWFMGGAALGGNVTPNAEFNIWADPEAAQLVLSSSVPLTMVGLDVTLKAVMTEEDAAELRDAGTRSSVLAAELLEFMFDRRDRGGEDAVMHDALALAAAVFPGCLSFRDCAVSVECKGKYTYGHTAVDLRGLSQKPPNVSVALGIDVKAFRRWLVNTIKSG